MKIDKTGHCIQLLNNASSIEELDLLCAVEGTTAQAVFQKVVDFIYNNIDCFHSDAYQNLDVEHYFELKNGKCDDKYRIIGALDNISWLIRFVYIRDALNEDKIKELFADKFSDSLDSKKTYTACYTA